MVGEEESISPLLLPYRNGGDIDSSSATSGLSYFSTRLKFENLKT
jgi:hypothetical protein